MAAKGSALKQEIFKKILETFPNSFLYNDGKEVRINGFEDGAAVQIKLTLTAAKVPVENENEVNFSINTPSSISKNETAEFSPSEKIPQEPTEEEKERLATLLSKLGL